MGVEPDLIRADSDRRPIPLVQSGAELEQAALPNLPCVPYVGDGCEARTRYPREWMQDESICDDCRKDEQPEHS